MSSAPTQLSTNRKRLRNIALLVLAGAVSFGVFQGTRRILKADPLEAYRKPVKDELPSNVAVFMKDSDFSRVEPNQPEAKCFVTEMRVAQNRQMYDFIGVSKGQLTWKKALYEFSAARGNWNGYGKILQLDGSVKLKSTKFDLASQELSYDEASRTIRVPRPVTGKLYGGDLQVANFVYNMENEEYSVGEGSWVGALASLGMQDTPGASGSREWKITFINGVGNIKKSNGIATYTDARATDGDIIIIAPKMVHDTKKDILTATGEVKYFSSKANVIADQIVVYRKEKRAVLSGRVTMLVKPKAQENEKVEEGTLPPMLPQIPDSISKSRPPAPFDKDTQKKREDTVRNGSNLRDYPLTITAGRIEYWYKKGERRANITDSPQARQELPEGEWRYAWAFSGKYDGEKETLTLESSKNKQDVILKNSLGDEIFGVWGLLSTKEGDDEYEFRANRAKMTTSDDDDIPPSKSGKGGGGLSGPIGNRRT